MTLTLVYLNARWIRRQRWPEGEEIILHCVDGTPNDYEASMLHESEYTVVPDAYCATEYALHLCDEGWSALEQRIESGECFHDIAVDYTVRFRRKPCPTVERHLLAESPCVLMFETISRYAKVFKAGDWPEAKTNLLKLSSQKGLYDAIVIYASRAMEGRWEEAEPLFKGSPKYLLEYAHKAMKGRLPEHLEQAMILKSFENPDDPHVKEYVRTFVM